LQNFSVELYNKIKSSAKSFTCSKRLSDFVRMSAYMDNNLQRVLKTDTTSMHT